MDMTEVVESVDINADVRNAFDGTVKTNRTATNIKRTLVRELSRYGISYETEEGKKITNAILKNHGLHESQFDFMSIIENSLNAKILNDDSIDPNANKSEKTIEAMQQEAFNPIKKAIGYDELYRQMKNDWGKEEAKRLSGLMYSYALALADSTNILKPYCFCIDARKLVMEGRDFGQLESKPCKRVSSYISALSETIHQMSNHLAGAIAVGTFFFDVAHLMMYTENHNEGYSLEQIRNDKDLRKYVENEYQQFVHSVNHLSRNAAESPFSNVSIFDRVKLEHLYTNEGFDAYFPNKDKEEVFDYIMEVQKIFIEFFDKGDPTKGGMMYRFPVVTMNVSKNSKDEVQDEEFLDYVCSKDIYRYNIFASEGSKAASCCRLINDMDTMKEKAAQSNSFGGSAISIGSHRVVTINFNRIALETNSKEEYFKLLDERIKDSAKILRSHKNLIKLLADKGLQMFVSNGWLPLDHFFSTFGVLGLVEAKLTSQKFEEYKTFDEDHDIIKDSLVFLNKKMEEYCDEMGLVGNIEQIPAESMAVRLCDVDKYIYGDKKVPFKLYANQFIPLWEEASLWEKLEEDGKYNKLITGGGIVHAQIGEKVTSTQAKRIIMHAIKCGCEHFALNAVYSVCENNHTTFGKKSTCPVCSSHNLDYYTRVVGFFTKVQNWNPVRREWEFPKRTYVSLQELGVDNPDTAIQSVEAKAEVHEEPSFHCENGDCGLDFSSLDEEEKKELPLTDMEEYTSIKSVKDNETSYILFTQTGCKNCDIAEEVILGMVEDNEYAAKRLFKVNVTKQKDFMKIAKILKMTQTPTLLNIKTDETVNSLEGIKAAVENLIKEGCPTQLESKFVHHTVDTKRRVCAKKIDYDIDESDGSIHNIKFDGGCPGNSKALAIALEGKDAEYVKETFINLECGKKGTSCIAELAKSIK